MPWTTFVKQSYYITPGSFHLNIYHQVITFFSNEFAISTKDIYYVQNLTRNIATFFGEYFSRRVSGQAKIFGGFKIGTKIYTL